MAPRSKAKMHRKTRNALRRALRNHGHLSAPKKALPRDTDKQDIKLESIDIQATVIDLMVLSLKISKWEATKILFDTATAAFEANKGDGKRWSFEIDVKIKGLKSPLAFYMNFNTRKMSINPIEKNLTFTTKDLQLKILEEAFNLSDIIMK